MNKLFSIFLPLLLVFSAPLQAKDGKRYGEWREGGSGPKSCSTEFELLLGPSLAAAAIAIGLGTHTLLEKINPPPPAPVQVQEEEAKTAAGREKAPPFIFAPIP